MVDKDELQKCSEWSELIEAKCPYCNHVGLYDGVGHWIIDDCQGCHKSFELEEK